MFRLALLAFLGLTALVQTVPTKTLLTWDDLTGRPQPKPDATVSYGADPYQKVDVWLPQGKGPFPTVLMVHGGCWTTSIADRSLMNWAADDLRRHDIAVWNIDYRGVDIAGGGYPGTFRDAAAASDLLSANAKKYHLDISKLVAVGHSAGGHIVLWLAGRHNLPKTSPLYTAHPLKIARVISLGGLPDLEATAASPENGCGTDVVGQLVGAATPAHPDIYADTSVPRLLPLGVPQDLVNGKEDHIIPYRLATNYIAQATKAGDHAALHTVANTGHVELITPDTAAWAETRKLIQAALK